MAPITERLNRFHLTEDGEFRPPSPGSLPPPQFQWFKPDVTEVQLKAIITREIVHLDPHGDVNTFWSRLVDTSSEDSSSSSSGSHSHDRSSKAHTSAHSRKLTFDHVLSVPSLRALVHVSHLS